MQTLEPPASYLCPITGEIFRDPVVAGDGHTYERKALQYWLLSQQTSPITRQVLQSTHLTPDYALKEAIAEWQLTRVAIEELNKALDAALEPHDASNSDLNGHEYTVRSADIGGAWTDDTRYFVRESINDPWSCNPQSLVLKLVWWLDLVGTMKDVSPGSYKVMCNIVKQHECSLQKFNATITTHEVEIDLGTHYIDCDEVAEPEGQFCLLQLGQIELTSSGPVTVHLHDHACYPKKGIAWEGFLLARIC